MTATGTLLRAKPATEDEFKFLTKPRTATEATPCVHLPCGTVVMVSVNHLHNRGFRCKNCVDFENQFHIKPTVDNPIMKVHCPHHHCYRVLKKDFYKKVAGEIKCPICEKLKVLDPLYKNAQVQFVFNLVGGHVID